MAWAMQRPCPMGGGVCGYMADSVLDVSEEDIYQDITVAKTIEIYQYITSLFTGLLGIKNKQVRLSEQVGRGSQKHSFRKESTP